MSMPLISIPEGLETKWFLLAPGALKSLPELIHTAFPGKTPWLIADENTWKVAGEQARSLLIEAGFQPCPEHIFPGQPCLHPDYAYSKMLAREMPANCVPVSIGSGVINDLTKCASGIAGVPYCCVPTACSVDGYTSAGAALSVEDFKKTVKCPPPFAICADTDILKTAPAPMAASGYADLLAKVPAGTDWIIADELGQHPIRQDVWELIQGHIRDWTADSADMLKIFDGLANTGYSMQIMRDSRPASGAEHLMGHIWEMEGLTFNGSDVSHGFKVGIGLLASTLLQQFVTEHSFEELEPFMKPGLTREERIAEIDELLVKGCYSDAPRITAMEKFISGSELTARRNLIREHWSVLQERIRKQLIPFQQIRNMLLAAHCPVKPSEIGLSREQFLHAVKTGQLIRIRYTVTDLLYELGLLDKAMETLEQML